MSHPSEATCDMMCKLDWKEEIMGSRPDIHNFGTSSLLQVINTLLFVIFSTESNYSRRKGNLLSSAVVREATSYEPSKRILKSFPVKGKMKETKVWRTCTASTDRTPFSHAFRTSRMAAGVLKQISCHFTWLAEQIKTTFWHVSHHHHYHYY